MAVGDEVGFLAANDAVMEISVVWFGRLSVVMWKSEGNKSGDLIM